MTSSALLPLPLSHLDGEEISSLVYRMQQLLYGYTCGAINCICFPSFAESREDDHPQEERKALLAAYYKRLCFDKQRNLKAARLTFRQQK
jgi:hypothetical protein